MARVFGIVRASFLGCPRGRSFPGSRSARASRKANSKAWYGSRRNTSPPETSIRRAWRTVLRRNTFSDAWPFYEALRHYSPAPYAAFLDLAGTQVVSGSPECFLKLSGRRIATRPIKGTRPRRRDAQRDQRKAYDLITSAKEIAELVMITDLERNDLGRVCEYGSVTVPELLKLESYEQVHHLVSTVTGHAPRFMLLILRRYALASRADRSQGLQRSAPSRSFQNSNRIRAGSTPGPSATSAITGKASSPWRFEPRYSKAAEVHFMSEPGIVADSIPEKEWQETLDKASGLILAAGSPPRMG